MQIDDFHTEPNGHDGVRSLRLNEEAAMIFKPQRFHGETPVVADENPPETTLEQRVADALALTAGTGAEGLKVVASGGEIFLFGAVASRDEMDRAVEVVLTVPGVEKVTVRMQTDEAP